MAVLYLTKYLRFYSNPLLLQLLLLVIKLIIGGVMTKLNRGPEIEHPCFAPQFKINVLKRGYSFKNQTFVENHESTY